MEEILSQLYKTFGENSVKIVFNIIFALLIILIGTKLVKFVCGKMRNSKAMQKVDIQARKFIESFIKIVLYVLVFTAAAVRIGIPSASIIALISSVGLALGLALQGGLTNIAGGLILLIFKPFRVGDVINVGDDTGTVKAIDIFYTTIVTPDNRKVVMPNGTISNATVRDTSAFEKRRVDMQFGVAYGTDIDRVKKILADIASEHPKVLKDSAPVIRLAEQADSALVIDMKVWCATGDYFTVKYDINEKVYEEFGKNGIEIPFPQLDVHVSGTDKQ